MAFVPEVSYEQSAGNLRESYDQLLDVFGFLPRFWQAQGTRPEIVRANLDLWHQLYRTGVLPSPLKEEMLLVVSHANTDSYCITAHLELLKRLGIEKDLGRKIVRDFESAPVPEEHKAVFRFAVKVTKEPFAIREADVAELRRHGWDDAAVLEICLVASHANFVNRLAAALGLVPDEVL